ncbi:MAG: gliding motility-associated C-terminal domain-containing protein, partial [Flavobacteriales bacterium]
MKKNYLFILMIAISAIQASAQSYSTPHKFRYRQNMTEKELYDMEFLQNMGKEDWQQFTQDPRFNADKVIALKTEWKKNHRKEHGTPKSSQTAGQTNCYWIEPTSDWEHPNTIQWPGSPGNSTDNYSSAISLGWNFNYFGQNFNQVVLTTKGTIALGNAGYIDFTPSAFPDPLASETNVQHDHICGFWTDFDFGAIGDLYYSLTPERLIVTYVNVGYWPNHDDLYNTFQMIITPDGSNFIGGGNNVRFTYLDMQFANSQISGASSGCGATNNLANVGCDRLSGTQHYAFGRFNICGSEQYNGPYGVNANQQDGVDWLDGRVIDFNTSVSNFNNNQPPVPVGEACDTITMCIGETFHMNLAFTSPESTQSTSIAWTQSGTGFSATATSGNAAILNNATFVASAANVGTNTVTITATDNGTPAASTVATYVFLVDDVVPPAISIDGVLTICAGQETELTASAGFDSYEWSNGLAGPTTTIDDPGAVTVVGHYGLCSSIATVNVDVTPYFIPQLVGGNTPIEVCPGIDTVVCVIGDYATYSWEIYPGYDGEFVAGTALDGPCAEVTGNVNGNYAIYVTDSTGCQGFNIKLVNTTPVFPCESNDLNNGPKCDGLEPLSFCGYTVPAEDNLVVYGLSTSQNGWQGSYINVYLYPADGGPMETYFFTTFGSLNVFDDVMIGAGDSIAIEYFSNNATNNNSLWVFNCGQNSPTIINGPLSDGIVWSALSTCYPSALPGTWSVTGPAGWSFSDNTQMTTVFTPGQYGEYELCFNNPTCAYDYCYNVVYTAPPTISLTPSTDVLLCDNESIEASAIVSDLANNATITWSGQGVVQNADEVTAAVGPYTGYTNTAVTINVENACGSATASFDVTHQPLAPEPSLNPVPLCANGSVTLDPIPAAQENSALQYDWNPGTSSGSTLTVTQAGTYSVMVFNNCDTSQTATVDIALVPAATITNVSPSNILECEDLTVPLQVQYANGVAYTVAWTGPVNATTNQITADQDGQYCYNITDIFGCNTSTNGCIQVEISSAPTVNSGSTELLALCPRECKQLELISPAEDTIFSWATTCNTYPITSNSGTINYCADNVPVECLGTPIVITGTVTNLCGAAQASWNIQSNACELTVPNIFTPNGSSENESFYIKGLENYTKANLQIFDRWGKLVYESENYKNDWRAQEMSEGTYYYILTLPYGIKTEYKGYVQIAR